MNETAVTQIPAPDSDFDIHSRGVLPAMIGRMGSTLTESTHADCYKCINMVRLARRHADRSGYSFLERTSDGHTGRVWAYDPGPDA
jgi:hypothetical protein